MYLRIASYVIEQLTYNSSSSENDIQIVEHDSETSSDVQDVALPTKKQKMDLKAKKRFDGAMYKTKFQSLWKGQYQFINPVPHDASSFHCTVCNKEISCAHQENEMS